MLLAKTIFDKFDNSSISKFKKSVKRNLRFFGIEKKTKTRIFSRKEIEALKKEGKKVREIRYFKEEINELLSDMNGLLLDAATRRFKLLWDEQVGFRNEYTIRGTMEELKGFKHFFYLDLKDAFHCMSRKEITNYLMELGFDFQMATKLAIVSTPQGKAFQGNPIAPLLFNLKISRALPMVQKCLLENGIKGKIIQYADDITIGANESIPQQVANKILKILQGYGCKIARQKVGFSTKLRCLGMERYYKTDNIRKKSTFVFRTYAKPKKLLKYWKHLQSKGITHSRRLRKDEQKHQGRDKYIDINMIIQGLNGWVKHTESSSKTWRNKGINRKLQDLTFC